MAAILNHSTVRGERSPTDGLEKRGTRVAALGQDFYECWRRSDCLGEERPFTLHLPTGHAPGRPGGWPLIVFLHGAGRNHRTLVTDPVTRAALQKCPCVVLLPDGGGSWWIDSPSQPGSRYQTYVLELLGVVTECLDIAREPSRRAVGGWSMGGFGSANLMADHPELFGAWGGLVALLDFPNDAYPREHNHSVPPVLADRSSWPKHNPMAKAGQFRGKELFFITAERAFDRKMNEAFHQRLEQLGVLHQFEIVSGAHDWPTVSASFPRLLKFLERAVGAGERRDAEERG